MPQTLEEDINEILHRHFPDVGSLILAVVAGQIIEKVIEVADRGDLL